jgi:predicted phage gp36 major capsid-like protein
VSNSTEVGSNRRRPGPGWRSINSGKILAENRRLQQELESKRDGIRRSHEKFEELARKSNIDIAKIKAEKQNNANENILLDLATLKHQKTNEDLTQLVKKHEREKEDAFRRRYKLEKDLISKQNLEMELAQLRRQMHWSFVPQ